MKNILLMVPRLNIGGAETYTALTAKNLKERGYSVHISSGGGLLADQLRKAGIKNSWLPMRFSTDLSAYLLKYIVKKHNIDLIHANSAAAGITAMKYKKKYNKAIPVVYTAHGKFGDLKREAILRNCGKIIYVSNFIKKESLKNSFKESNACVIYTGIDFHKFDINKINRKVKRETYNIRDDDFVLSITARVKNLRNKGHQDLLEMMNKYPAAKKWHLLVIGKGKGLLKLKRQIKKYGLEKNIHCVGHVDNVQDFVRLSDVAVLPSDFETFGLALAEGMAMGKAGVGYNIGGIPEIIQNGENGFLTDYKNIDDLYAKLNILAQDRELRRKLGNNAHEYIKTHFSVETMMNKIEDVYKEVLQQSVIKEGC